MSILDSCLNAGDVAIWLGNPHIKRDDQLVILIETVADGRRWEVELRNGNRVLVRTEEIDSPEE